MTVEEFSDEFDVMIGEYNSIPSFGVGQNPLAFDEYEKSLFLTRAQFQIVETLYTGQLGTSFEETEQLRRYLSNLVETAILIPNKSKRGLKYSNETETYIIDIPEVIKLMYITFEQAILDSEDPCIKGKIASIIPTTQDEVWRTSKNPYRASNERRVLRLDTSNNQLELVSKYPILRYEMRYLRKPRPILLVDLSNIDHLSIDSELNHTQKGPCTSELDSSLHRKILDLAVQTAIQTKLASTNANNKQKQDEKEEKQA